MLVVMFVVCFSEIDIFVISKNLLVQLASKHVFIAKQMVVINSNLLNASGCVSRFSSGIFVISKNIVSFFYFFSLEYFL